VDFPSVPSPQPARHRDGEKRRKKKYYAFSQSLGIASYFVYNQFLSGEASSRNIVICLVVYRAYSVVQLGPVSLQWFHF
jgi:hypothetical protein